jgi:O-antigen/teichoic acid export membrane protein
MAISVKYLLKGTFWSVGAYGLSQAIRLVTSVIVARLLSPQLFGLFQVITALRTGVALLSDFGVAQNIIYSPNATDFDFYNTAWTLEIIRTSLLWLFCLLAAIPIADFYNYPPLSYMLPIAALTLVIIGFSSPGRYLLQKAMRIAELSAFEVITSFFGALALIASAYVTSSIWALIVGNLIGSAIITVGTFFLHAGIRHRFRLTRRYVGEIMSFGKWVFLTSILYFLSQNYDKLYLAKLIPLEVLGIYGIARNMCDLVNTIILRLGNSVLFPFIASHSSTSRAELRAGLLGIRAKFLVLACLGFAAVITVSDLLIKILYDQRYHAASWMLPTLLIGTWFSVLSGINEAALLGLVGPKYNSFSNGAKFVALVIGLQPSFDRWGTVGIIAVIALSDFCRYVPTCIGQKLENFSFIRQDLLFTVAAIGFTALFEGLRWFLGFGTSFDSLLLQ